MHLLGSTKREYWSLTITKQTNVSSAFKLKQTSFLDFVFCKLTDCLEPCLGHDSMRRQFYSSRAWTRRGKGSGAWGCERVNTFDLEDGDINVEDNLESLDAPWRRLLTDGCRDSNRQLERRRRYNNPLHTTRFPRVAPGIKTSLFTLRSLYPWSAPANEHTPGNSSHPYSGEGVSGKINKSRQTWQPAKQNV